MHPLLYLMDNVLGIANFMLSVWFIISMIPLSRNSSDNPLYKIIANIRFFVDSLFLPVLNWVKSNIKYSVIGSLDLSPIIIYLIISFARYLIHYYGGSI